MKVEREKISTDVSGSINKSFFSIGNEGLVFDILRTKIYNDPIEAITREISTNARDAHKEVGKHSQPIEVILPTYYDSIFTVKDYGPGISPDRIENIFIKYGNSTKRDDNDQTGGFGLGSKSCFSYSDSFTIVTTFDKITYTYNAFIDETHKGCMALISKEKTNAQSGTSIIIPTKSGDADKFARGMLKATEFWDVRPKCNTKLNYVNDKYIYKNENSALRESKKAGYYSEPEKSLAIIDGIQYTLDFTKFKSKISNFLQSPFLLYFGNGELSLSASRDSIHFDQKTINKITEKAELALSDLSSIITDKVKNAASIRDARKLFIDTTKALPGLEIPKVKWNDLDVCFELTIDGLGNGTSRASAYIYSIEDQVKCKDFLYTKSKGKVYASSLSLYDAEVDYYIMDDNRDDLLAHARRLQQDGKRGSVCFIAMPETHMIGQKEEPSSYKTEYLKVLNFPNSSTIGFPNKQISSKSRFKAKNNNEKITVYKLSTFNPYVVDNTGGIYVIYDAKENAFQLNQPISSRRFNADDLVDLASTLKIDLVGITKCRSAKLNQCWVNLNDYIVKYIAENKAKFPTLIKSNAIVDWMAENRYHFNVLLDLNKKKLLKENSPAQIFINKIIDAQKEYKDAANFMDGLRNLDERWGKKLSKLLQIAYNDDKYIDLKEFDAIYKEYPLLKAIESNQECPQAAVIEYIDFIDGKMQKKS